MSHAEKSHGLHADELDSAGLHADELNKDPLRVKEEAKSGVKRREDPYLHEGAVEQDAPNQSSNNSLTGQIGHRNKPADLDTLDTDFPEPGQNPEHSGK
jgi:hypothetical protein